MLTGYLGAGKTTLLNHVLGLPGIRDRRIALIINEFGPLGVDGKLVKPGPHHVFELNRGSVFCICIKTDFLKTLDAIAQEVKPDLVIVEATGVADPCDLDHLLGEPRLKAVFKPWANICLVDAPSFTQVAAFLRTTIRQVQWADGLVINKTDMVSAKDLQVLNGVLKGLNERAPQVEVAFGKIPESFIHGLSHVSRAGEPIGQPPEGLVAVSIEDGDRPVDLKRFMDVLSKLEGRLLRLKGNLCLSDGERVFVEVVNGRFSRKPPVSGLNKTAFTVISWGMSKEELRAAFHDCFLTESK
jgi:G3E family GTPase